MQYLKFTDQQNKAAFRMHMKCRRIEKRKADAAAKEAEELKQRNIARYAKAK